MRHKVFVSYHHVNDQYYKNLFDNLFSNIYDIMVSKSVQIGDIDSNLPTERIRQKIRDEYLRDINNNIEIDIPKNYFLNDKPENLPVFTWEKFSKIFYSNWLLSF